LEDVAPLDFVTRPVVEFAELRSRAMRTHGLAALAVLVVGCHAEGRAEPPHPEPPPRHVSWALADGWRREVTKFPPDFAKTLPYRGEEERHFMPGFLEPTAADYGSYVFAWILEPGPALETAAVERDLVTYFRGLCREVGRGKLEVDDSRFRASLHAVGDAPKTRNLLLNNTNSPELRGTVDTYDPYKTGKPLTLNVRIHQAACIGASAERIVLFAMTPRPDADPVWVALDGAVEAFFCQGPALF
jgi:hypothetical protein